MVQITMKANVRTLFPGNTLIIADGTIQRAHVDSRVATRMNSVLENIQTIKAWLQKVAKDRDVSKNNNPVTGK